MTFSADVYEIAILLIAIAFLVLVIAIIPTLTQLRRTVRSMEELSNEGRKTVEAVNVIAERVGDQTEDIDEMVQRFKGVGEKTADLADMVLDNLRGPLITILSLILGFEFGLKHISKHKKKDADKEDKPEGGSSHE